MRSYYSRWRHPTRRDLGATVLVCGLVLLAIIWGIHEMRKQSQEAKYESCLREAETKHVFPWPASTRLTRVKKRRASIS